MAFLGLRQLAKQTKALFVKNLHITVIRSPIGFLLSIYGFPLAVLAVLLSIPSFLLSSNKLGIASPASIRDLADTVHKKLVIVKPPHLGPDVDRVIQIFTKSVSKDHLQFIEDETELATICLSNLRGISGCHAAVTFFDSPETTVAIDIAQNYQSFNEDSIHHTWQYVIRADPARNNGRFDVSKHNSDDETLFLPLQLAINNAITNSTAVPEVFMVTAETQEANDKEDQSQKVKLIGQIYPFGLFACYFVIVYRLTTFITADRESGMSQLVDGMGGSTSTVARVLSWLLVFDLTCLPCFIVFGVLYWHILFPSSSVGLLIGWQILLGLAVNSSTVFAAAFFTKSRVSAIYVMGAFLLLSVGAQVYSFQHPILPSAAGVYPLTVLFASANHLFFTQQMALWELKGAAANIHVVPPKSAGINSTSYNVTQSEMLGFLAIIIIVYPILAILVERFMHGIDFRKRSFNSGESDSTGVVVEAFDLKKRFVPNILERIFCCGRRKTVKAVDGVSLQGHRGQILCLVGPNGSGKTTTLHMMSGFHSPTNGSVKLNAMPSQIGICPQRNTLWENLTVKEHVSLWSKIKGGQESQVEIDHLIASCDLERKRNSLAKTLSGGQKRKLQLACMFIGNSSVCLIDECTSGLDPLSRRVIWEILMEQRSKRSIVFTTHFLDEVDVLADHIVILSKGKVRCQGAATELKNLYGGGYNVVVPCSAPDMNTDYPSMRHQDRLVYKTPDSRTAAQLTSSFAAAGVSDVTISGPQVEDVFLRVADEPELEHHAELEAAGHSEFEMTPGEVMPFWAQVKVLLRKRFTVLRRFWWPYFYVLALPLIITPFFDRLIHGYKVPPCANLEPNLYAYSSGFNIDAYCASPGGYCSSFSLGPQSANQTLYHLVQEKFQEVAQVNITYYDELVNVVDSQDAFMKNVVKNRITGVGGIYTGSGNDVPLIGYQISDYGSSEGTTLLNLWSQMASDVEIVAYQGTFANNESGDAFANLPGIVFAIFFTLVQAVYPAAFVLYPAIEKFRKVRALQYANGVRRGPLWVAYGIFDFMFVLVLSVAVTAIISTYLTWNGPIWVMIPVLALYGLSAILLGYVVSHFVSGPLKSFLAMMGLNVALYAIAAIGFGVGYAYADAGDINKTTLGISFGLYLILPIGNVFRAVLVGLNVLQVGCKDGTQISPGSIAGFGGPILYLFIQIAILLVIIIWIEGDIALFRAKGTSRVKQDVEKIVGEVTRSQEVEAETVRVEECQTDLLRVLHLSKSFHSNKAVDDVSLGLPQSDVMALIGPNGAGKSTLVNLIQSELSPDHGRALLRNEDARTRSAQKYLGVCPQYDALDLMSTRDHLSFYARVKGIKDVQGNVNHVMRELNLTPHAATLASKLSGGNKRKLSLAIALMGTPPVLVLDEPTSAMDAVAKRAFWKIIQKITPGRSLLLTTHSMEEADTLATRAAIISSRLLAVGSTQALRDKYSNLYYISLLLTSAPNSTPGEMDHIRSWIDESIPGARLERDMLGGQVRFTVPGVDAQGKRPVAGLIEMLESNKQGMGVEYYSVAGATLENVFLSVVKENNVQEEDGVGHKGSLFRRMFKR